MPSPKLPELEEPVGLSQKEASRIRVPGSFATSAGWQSNPREFDCYAYFRESGELLCVPVAAKTSSGEHPLQRVLDLIDQAPTVLTLDDLPDAKHLALPIRLRKFSAAWASKSLEFIDLKLGTIFLGFLGWIGEERPPIYPVVRSGFVGLYSHSRITDLRLERL